METKIYITVILPLKLEWEPCYYIEKEHFLENYDHSADIGRRVKVKFAGKEYIGVISSVGAEPEMDRSRIKPIECFEDGIGKILPEEMELWKKVAEYYLCTVGEVYKAAYPLGKVSGEEARAIAKEKAKERAEAQRARKISTLEQRIARLEARLVKKEEQLSKARKDSVKERYVKDIDCINREILFLQKTKDDAARQCMEFPAYSSENNDSEIKRPELSAAQEEAIKKIREGFSMKKPVLLNGVTGSGKTEIYIKLALETLQTGKNVLYLVPEITLSRQLEERLRHYLGKRLLVFHSRETFASKRDTAEKLRITYGKERDEEGYIVLGTRSSLFLPHHDLGLIIVDEEHDSSYKQDSPAPRYNGRDTALILSTIQESNIILGSATPSLEELYNCKKGRHTQVLLKERFHGSQDSEVEIIDTRAERRKNGMKGSFSRKLIAEINDTLSRGEQVVILRARRAWAPVLQCEDCGEIVRCPHCNVSLSLHKGEHGEKMTCHWCGHSVPAPGQCNKCDGKLIPLGAGTQRIEEEAEHLFPQARIARLDSDTVQNRSYESKIIKEFSEGKIDILVGTQIVTKGFDFSGLSLVVVIAADSLLGIQDFRADEKALQLLQQLRGRSGRRAQRGKFIIQTAQSYHPIYTHLSDAGEDCFSLGLLQERQDFGFPPYTRIIELHIKDIYEDRADRMSQDLGRMLRNMNVTGPYTPAVSRIADQHIRMIRISLPKDRNLRANKEGIKRVIAEFERDRRYEGHITINVDPS